MGSAYGTPPTCKGIFSMAAAQATGWHAMSDSAAEDFRKENYIIAGIIVYLDLLPAVLRAIGSRLMLDAKTVQDQERYFDNKSSQPAAVADKKQQEVKVGSRSYEARAKKFDTKSTKRQLSCIT